VEAAGEARRSAAWPQPEPNIGRYQVPDLGIGFDHDLTLAPRGYFDGIYSSPFQDQMLADLALTVLDDRNISLGRRGKPTSSLSRSRRTTSLSHNFGNESEEELDTLRRLDHELGRLLAAFDAWLPKSRAERRPRLSADHGFTPLPEVVRRTTATGGSAAGCKAATARRDPVSQLPGAPEPGAHRRALLAPGSQPIYGSEG